MAVTSPPQTKPARTKTSPRRSGGWFTRILRKVKLAYAGDNEELIVENKTAVSWRVYHEYHHLGVLDSGERQTYYLTKHGSLNARPMLDGDDIEYLVQPLTNRVHRILIYHKRLGKEFEVYDMRVN